MTNNAVPPIEFIPNAGACITTKNVMSRAGRIKFMVREFSQVPADNGWRIFSDIDSSEYLRDSSNMVIASFNDLCALEPALIGIYDLAVGSDLQIVSDGQRKSIVDTRNGIPLPDEFLYVPGRPPREWGRNTPGPNPGR